MIYDLSIPKKQPWRYPLPFQPKAKVSGINLLRTCRQIREETLERIWYKLWALSFPLLKQSDPSTIDLALATSSLHNLALAKIPMLDLSINIDASKTSSCGLINLQMLSSFKSLSWLSISVTCRSDYEGLKPEHWDNPRSSVFLRGLVIQILLQIPPQVRTVCWHIWFWEDGGRNSSNVLESIAEEYQYLKGAHYGRKIGPS